VVSVRTGGLTRRAGGTTRSVRPGADPRVVALGEWVPPVLALGHGRPSATLTGTWLIHKPREWAGALLHPATQMPRS